jgi:hypothetical protein
MLGSGAALVAMVAALTMRETHRVPLEKLGRPAPEPAAPA